MEPRAFSRQAVCTVAHQSADARAHSRYSAVDIDDAANNRMLRCLRIDNPPLGPEPSPRGRGAWALFYLTYWKPRKLSARTIQNASVPRMAQGLKPRYGLAR
jgi:hypothetical protein